jgi:hypothetical protein
VPERDELDRMIDAELARYGEPRVGLEQRILARVSAQGSRPSWPVRAWQVLTLAGAIAALVFAMSILFLPRTAHRGTGATTARSTSVDDSPVASVKSVVPETPIRVPHVKEIAKPASSSLRNYRSPASPGPVQRPKLDVFPAPQPLSPQERAMINFARQLPDAERQKLIVDQKHTEEPLQVSSIRISPITVPELGKN